jgi:cysteine synthase A
LIFLIGGYQEYPLKIVHSILEMIGHTPLLKLKMQGQSGINIWAKLEYLNPSGSLKDRIALRMIEDAEKNGKLKAGFTILESSTGNTGIALSFVGAMKGYKVVIYETTPGEVGEEKRKIMSGYGAEVRSLPPDELEYLTEKSVSGYEVELPGRVKCLELEQENPTYWWARQFANPSNVTAHHDTGREIIEQLEEPIDAFVASIGTGGTLMGVAEVIKEKYPKARIVGVLPASSKIKFDLENPIPATDVHGGILSEIMKRPGLIDDLVKVTDKEAVEMTHRLRQEEGIFAGVSSGANVLTALRVSKKLAPGANVVTIFPDNADRYFSDEHYVT